MLVIATIALVAPLRAQDSTAKRLPAVTVTRDKARSPLDLPYAISATRPDSLSPGQPHNLTEQVIAFLPGVTLANRNNPAQDARISVRGFGARSQFGVRSVRVLRDGMPLTMPDGQTPIDYLDLESVGAVEAIRGSASALYGNASGGVIDLTSAPPPPAPVSGQVRSWGGSNGLSRHALLIGGVTPLAWYRANLGRTKSDGSRDWSQQELTNGFLRAGTTALGTSFTLIGLGMDMPIARNPGALTKALFDVNGDTADPLSMTRKSRKAVHQVQVALQANRPLGAGDVNAQVYGGTRSLYNPLIPNVVALDRHSGGGSVRATLPLPLGQRFTVGVDAQRMSDARRNWAPCNGILTVTANCPTPNVDRGVLQLDQREIVTSVGPYVRDEMELGPAIASIGLRGDRTRYSVTDHFTSDGRNDSGERTMSALSPMAGVSLRVRDGQSVYLNLSTAFETPTTTEMVNKPDSSAGLNPTLKPQRSATMEIGAKGAAFGLVHYDFALYATNVRDELIGFDIGGGRNAYRNVGRTRRRGAELTLSANWRQFGGTLGYTHSEFTFVDFLSGTTQLKGNTIPGVPKRQVQATASWRSKYGWALVEWMAKDKIFVNDANAAAAPGYAVTNLRAGSHISIRKPWLAPVFGVQNVFDRKYVSSVAINAAGTVTTGKFYEPGPGRTWYVGLAAATAPW